MTVILSSNTVSRSKAERLKDSLAVVFKLRVPEKPLRNEALRVSEIGR